MSDLRPLCLMSIPNSGSTWLAELISQHTHFDRYAMEFFNPLRNMQHLTRLQAFGCELIESFTQIARPIDTVSFHSLIRDLWRPAGFNFTKEVFSPFKLPAFAEYFDCFVLLRSFADSFPPSRLRMWSFYEHAWHALRVIHGAYEYDEHNLLDRCVRAHHEMSDQLIRDASERRIPIVRYDQLFDDRALPGVMARALHMREAPPALIDAIRATRTWRSA